MVAIAKTPAVLSSEILIKSSGYIGWFILLEGDFDQRFWASRLNPSHLKPINCVGKANVLGTLDLLISTNKAQKVIALADKDYDEVLARLMQYSQLVYTDENDLEVTLLRCPSSGITAAIGKILGESVDTNKRESFEASIGFTIVEHLQKMASNYGVLRLINEQLGSGVDFDQLPILHSSFLNHAAVEQNHTILLSTFVNAVNQAGRVVLIEADLLAYVESHRINGLFSKWALVQGHDLMQLLAIAINSKVLRHATGHKQASEDSLARDLCLMIHRHDLQTTGMFRTLEAHGDLAKLKFFK